MDKERIERRSRRGARFTLVGYLVTILAFIMMYFLMSKGQGRVRVLTNVIDVQEEVID